MTLLELSVYYADSAAAIRSRILQLRAQEHITPDPEEARRLRRRMEELQPLLREARALAILTARYYDRSYHRDERYTL